MEKQASLKTLAIIIPARNEEEQIANTVKGAFASINDYKIKTEVIIVNDGSTDKTGDILLNLAKTFPSIIIINHEKSQGLGAAFLAGCRVATSDYVFLLPGDNENDPASILANFNLIGDYDVLISYVINPESRSIFRQRISSLYTFLMNKSFGHNLRYFNGTSIYKVEILKKLSIQSTGFFFSAEILLKILKQSNRYIEVPIKLNILKQTKSSALSIRSFKEVFKGFIHMLVWQYGTSSKDNT